LIIDINSGIKHKAIEIRKEARLKLPDAIIAATAMSMDLPLLTADKAFSKIADPRIILYEL
jgi:predicted nucleic acid-binding protein